MSEHAKFLAGSLTGSLVTIGILFLALVIIRGRHHAEVDDLMPGDLLFARDDNPLSFFTQQLGFYWTHMAVYVGDGKMVEVKPSTGVVLVDTSSWDNKIDTETVHIKGLTASNREGIVNFVSAQIGKGYNFAAFVNVLDDPCYPRNTSIDSPNWYCSEIAWAAYLSQGINLDNNDSMCTVSPQAIYDRLS